MYYEGKEADIVKIELAENIRRFRKQRGITQEQLSEAMGVTVGAVSKWETGSSVPDIGLIIALAELFETSVDSLLGYGIEKGALKRHMKELNDAFKGKQYDKAVPLAEKLLLKYPNNFDVVHKSALLFKMKGIEQRSNPSLARSLELYERALELVDQNTAERVNRWSLCNAMAKVYLTMGELDKGLEMLKANNAQGVNDADIGSFLAQEEGREDEAADYLSVALMRNAMQLVNVMYDIAVVYEKRGNMEKTQEAYRWVCSFVGSLTQTGAPGYLDHLLARSMTELAVCLFRCGDKQQAGYFLAAAKEKAVEFDAAPDYSLKGMRFYQCEDAATGFTDFGVSACDGVVRTLMEQEQATELMELWNSL